MNISVSQFASVASSTAYWMIGRSMMDSISFGVDFGDGKNRVPKPETGNTAFFNGIFFSSQSGNDWPSFAKQDYQLIIGLH
jgi:hypothetical protein